MDTLFVYAAKDPNGGSGVIQSKNSLLFESHGGDCPGIFTLAATSTFTFLLIRTMDPRCTDMVEKSMKAHCVY